MADEDGWPSWPRSARLWRGLLAFSGYRDVANDPLGEAFAQGLARGKGIQDPLRWVNGP